MAAIQVSKRCHRHVPVHSSLLQVGFIVSVLAVLPNQFMGVRLVWRALSHQGDADAQGAAVVVHLQKKCVGQKGVLERRF